MVYIFIIIIYFPYQFEIQILLKKILILKFKHLLNCNPFYIINICYHLYSTYISKHVFYYFKTKLVLLLN